LRDVLEVRRLPADQAPDRDDRVVTGCVREERDGCGELERTRDLEEIDARTRIRRALDGAALEGEGDLFVPPGANDRDVGAALSVCALTGACLSGRHRSHSIGALAVASRVP